MDIVWECQEIPLLLGKYVLRVWHLSWLWKEGVLKQMQEDFEMVCFVCCCYCAPLQICGAQCIFWYSGLCEVLQQPSDHTLAHILHPGHCWLLTASIHICSEGGGRCGLEFQKDWQRWSRSRCLSVRPLKDSRGFLCETQAHRNIPRLKRLFKAEDSSP